MSKKATHPGPHSSEPHNQIPDYILLVNLSPAQCNPFRKKGPFPKQTLKFQHLLNFHMNTAPKICLNKSNIFHQIMVHPHGESHGIESVPKKVTLKKTNKIQGLVNLFSCGGCWNSLIFGDKCLAFPKPWRFTCCSSSTITADHRGRSLEGSWNTICKPNHIPIRVFWSVRIVFFALSGANKEIVLSVCLSYA